MAIGHELHVALKEWATVCTALETGRQILLLRKGGIHETGGQFELEHSRFLLFPTYLHQNHEMLKENERAALQVMSSEPSQVSLSAAAEVADIIRMKSRAQMDAIDDQHVWTNPLIDMRFNYKPHNPLYLLLLHVYRLEKPIVVANTPEYAGCKSWVPLREAVEVGHARPVLSDSAFEERRRVIRERISE
jgi:hypothetical protein